MEVRNASLLKARGECLLGETGPTTDCVQAYVDEEGDLGLDWPLQKALEAQAFVPDLWIRPPVTAPFSQIPTVQLLTALAPADPPGQGDGPGLTG